MHKKAENTTAKDNAAKVYAVIVTYHPDMAVTEQLLERLSAQVEKVIVIDNGSAADAIRQLRSACIAFGAKLIELHTNTGIAHAQNVGIKRALAAGADYVLLSDQDSLPEPDMAARLLSFFAAKNSQASSSFQADQSGQTGHAGNTHQARQASSGKVGAVGPCIRDFSESRASASTALAYLPSTWAPRKASPAELAQPALPVAFLLASGCLISRQALLQVGPMNEAYFIDHVDMEWCLRAAKQGFELWVDTSTPLAHSFGDEIAIVPFINRTVHVHSPLRGYYITRNTLALCRAQLMPLPWRVRYLLWLIPYCGFNVLLAGHRLQRLHWIGRGLRDAIVGRTGSAERPKACR